MSAAVALMSLGVGVSLLGRDPRRLTAIRSARKPAAPQLGSIALVLDLVAAALRSGLAVEAALAAVARAAERSRDPQLVAAAEPLAKVGRLLGWGAEPAQAWRAAELRRDYEAAAAAGRRCAGSGARLADALAAAAQRARADRHRSAILRAHRVGVWSLLPLGLCFLPAFVCLGVIPVIGGLGASLLAP